MPVRSKLSSKIFMASGFILMAFSFITYRYDALGHILFRGLPFLSGICLIIVAGWVDEDLRHEPIFSPRLLDGLLIGLLSVMYLATVRHFGIGTNADAARGLFQNNTFFVAFLLFVLVVVMRMFLTRGGQNLDT